MNELDLTNNFRRYDEYIVTADLFKYIGNICVKKLSLKHNGIQMIDASAFQKMRYKNCLEDLSLHLFYDSRDLGCDDNSSSNLSTFTGVEASQKNFSLDSHPEFGFSNLFPWRTLKMLKNEQAHCYWISYRLRHHGLLHDILYTGGGDNTLSYNNL
ncbi:unnamed protein product [Mytilus coruscus]|uniref:Uncharacterized protein n=1 Tax=Mytilus coruscus TaxID=42192 RepID=A0A6J8A5Z7_MYTCO|nr:unnamed protein product [Mytilus coruscus]